MIGSFAIFIGLAFVVFFFWLRLSAGVSTHEFQRWVVSVALACLFFIVCFALGVWFSVARLKGAGWVLSA